jgi:hypothetical protein
MQNTRTDNREKFRFFVTYTGVKLPFRLINELQPGEVKNRNVYFRGYFDVHDRLVAFDKLAYSEIELSHRYTFHENGILKRVVSTDIDGEVKILNYDSAGIQLSD